MMKKTLDNETQLNGGWVKNAKGQIVEDEMTLRIKWLVKNYLTKVKTSDDGWNILFTDPNDSRYWEMIYKESEFHGGGAPSLITISEIDARLKYKI